jgi:uncharacterized cupredoxin-like copper-binding protein
MDTSIRRLLAGLTLALVAPALHAHGDARHAPKAKQALSTDEHPWGREGDPRKASRTITVDMGDDMRFKPAHLEIKAGETVRFVVANKGKLMHEMVIGTEAELAKHAELMRKHPGMEHEEPYMAHVSPGKREEIAWTFTKAGTFMYGCLIPGHWESGMKGTIVVAAR